MNNRTILLIILFIVGGFYSNSLYANLENLSASQLDDTNRSVLVKSPGKTVSSFREKFPANGAISIGVDGTVFISEYGSYSQGRGTGTRLFILGKDGKVAKTLKGLSGPMGSVSDRKGNLFVVDANNGKSGNIVKFDQFENKQILASLPGWPSGMAMGADNHLYVTNYNSPVIHRVSPSGDVSVYAQDERLNGCVGIDFDSAGNLIVGNFYTAKLLSISEDGTVSEIATVPNVVVQGWGLGYLTVFDDTIYTTAIAKNKIYKVELNGNVSVLAGTGEFGSDNGELGNAMFRNPNGIAVDKRNRIIYVSEFGADGGIRAIDLSSGQ
ncbi:hypothetical protein NBRC116583_26510 [Arenicella sp. 4NH20-0111]|uniref:Vgb family protein n=1 Tax=Arenicella sp. 4NH20-0111 TaxID=3127648 RepID=UPI00310350FF